MRKLFTMLIAVSGFSFCALTFAEVAVIVHPSSGIASMTDDDVARIFLGKSNNCRNTKYG